jgi:hypothetical protein
MSRVTAVARLRLAVYTRAYLAIAPTLGGLVVLALLYGGGVAEASEAYGVSGIVLFPVFAWQTKIVLDGEPDVQRRLTRVAVGSADREIAGGLLAALACAVPTTALALALPWILGGIKVGHVGLAVGLLVGLWVHVLSAVAGVALGVWSSRSMSRTAGIAVCVLAAGSVLTIVLGRTGSPVFWLVPPLDAIARATEHGTDAVVALGLTLWTLGWSALVAGVYWWRRRRAV